MKTVKKEMNSSYVEQPGVGARIFDILWNRIKPFVDMIAFFWFIWKLYKINISEDKALIDNGFAGQIVYKLVGFFFLILYLGPYLIDYS